MGNVILSKKTLQEQVRDHLSSMINSGKYSNGVIPTEAKLCEIYDVSRITVRQAVTDLVEKGILYRVTGRGTFIRESENNKFQISTENIGIIFQGGDYDILSDPYLSNMFLGIQGSLSQYNYSTFVHMVPKDVHHAPIPGFLSKNNIDGIIFIYEAAELYTKIIPQLNIPHICVGYISSSGNDNTVMPNNKQGAEKAVRYLVELGHKRIGIINGNRDFIYFNERHEGYLDELTKYKLKLKKEDYLEVNLPITDNGQQLQEFFSRKNLPSAYLIGYDRIAVECIAAIKANGLKIPEDISIIGFNNLPLSAQTDPPLTTIDIYQKQLGEEAANSIMQMINNGKTKASPVRLSTKLVERISCAKI